MMSKPNVTHELGRVYVGGVQLQRRGYRLRVGWMPFPSQSREVADMLKRPGLRHFTEVFE